ncbi:putative cinnamoyl-CoA reductase [Helianthus annuus]|uniref:Cinnamoyl-CoA reductase n=1 Tax=Helianthus annuus TaxID=4232 RepID=A0A251RNY3_HELAN|nr:cinnamoyl-CoA reductase-like SNL6 [Helianthus annuus]KAF5755135.1 putative cinnamoyl-CoA reductase [Helianthus annuus]KAJ0428904.1 putative cinnamoyl-CoA reductase [Helianthus annuus]KAJ0433111.1 putative cinnamoyl-CoA reductase [Helianthus annuus]KAJ0447244.1 putative cinnamoyl-CoA reductase [Helianthus annuus]KAJ0632157.1 putative cinnamoyl-CoA reductase [Helianthus annuus]
MGVVRTDESRRSEIEEFRRMLLSCSAVVVKVSTEDERNLRRLTSRNRNEYTVNQKLVCVTSGVSFLGIAIVKQLVLRGYSVRVIVDNEEDIDRLREIEVSEDIETSSRITNNNRIGVVVAKFNDCQSLMEAFDGCYTVFHTTSFIDPSGFSGYSKAMAEIEAKAAENVAEACAATPSVRNYVFTSSLLTCIWRDTSNSSLSPIVDHNSWSDESFCTSKKLWYALGKLKAERASWRIAEETGLKLSTICSGLITGPRYFCANPSSTIAYLKGGQDMYEHGLLATVDVNKLAEAHVKVHEEMNKTGGGRYVCFDEVVRSPDEVHRLEQETGLHINTVSHDNVFRFELSNRKLDKLMSQVHRCTSVC